jgi:two-component system, NtrC family, nitrogen regulation sensor histidine kinase GlnL
MPPPSIHDEVFTHLHAAVLLLNRDQQILYMNPAAERLLSLSLTTARQRSFPELLKIPESFRSSLEEVLQEGRTIRIHEIEVSVQGSNLPIQVEMAPIGSPEEPSGVFLWMNELGMTHALQEEHRVQDRLTMVGTMASGLAHEIRNPLGGIRGAAQMFVREADSAELKEYGEMITAEVDRLNELISQLLDFTKPKKIKKGPVNIHRILAELFKLLEEEFQQKDIQLHQNFDPSLPELHAHGPSLKQALLNLLKNAMEAISGGGEITVGTQFHSYARVWMGEGMRGPVAEVWIEDTGTGISKEDLPHLFTPFFSTKPKGTGLGLMMVQRILKEHGGTLKVESESGKGTILRMFLKLAPPTAKD